MGRNSTSSEDSDVLKIQYDKGISDVYKDLELHISGQLVATATRSPPKCDSNALAVDYEDQIKVFLIWMKTRSIEVRPSQQSWIKDSLGYNRQTGNGG